MQEYRAYILGPDGHVRDRVDIVCDDDETAKEKAKQLVDGQDVELWQVDRRIATFKATH
jgi:hypothetical protein